MTRNMQPKWSIYMVSILMLGLDSKLAGEAFQPEFVEPIGNLSVPIGRDATFRCLVQNLGGYRVGWVKADTKAIQAIHIHVITNNHRVGVSHNGQTVWNLHIRNVQEDDRGKYMCQINTDPMQSQMGYLEVVVPPDFIAEETSGDVMVPEGGTARLSCRARGQPTPRVMWRKEDGSDIVIRFANSSKSRIAVYENEELTLNKISRSDMGAYLCIASNGVPPSVSKRIVVKVHFHPVIQVPNQLVGAPLGTDVTLECYVESFPKSINYWVSDSNEMVISSSKYEVTTTMLSSFESRMTLVVRHISDEDLGGYKCIAKNSLGEVDGTIRLYGITRPLQPNSSPPSESYQIPIEGPDNQFGSAEKSDDEDESVTGSSDNTQISTYNNYSLKNKSSFQTTPNSAQNVSNRVRKILNNLEHGDINRSSSSSSMNTFHRIFVISTAIYMTSFNRLKYVDCIY